MGYDKGKMSGGSKFMNSGKGLCSYKDGTMSAASRVKPECGPGMNADQRKANGLLQKAQKQVDSQRGQSGM